MIVLPVTYKLIATTTVSTATAANIEFTSIPATFDDLVILASARTDRASVTDDIKLEFNGVNTNQTLRTLFGNGATASSATDTLIYGWTNGGNSTASTFGSTSFYIPNYAGSTNKSVSIDAVNEGNQTTQYQGLNAGLWSSTAAITSIKLLPYTGPNFVQYSSASLYGIKKS